MATMTATEAKNRFGDLLEQVRDEPVTIQRNGRDVAILITPQELERRIASDRGMDGVSAKVRAAADDVVRRYETTFRKLAE